MNSWTKVANACVTVFVNFVIIIVLARDIFYVFVCLCMHFWLDQ